MHQAKIIKNRLENPKPDRLLGFPKFYFSLLLFGLILIIGFSILIYSTTSREIKSVIHLMIHNDFRKSIMLTEQVQNSLQLLTSQIINDSAIVSLFQDSTGNQQKKRGYDQMDNYVSTHPYILSIYVYDGENRKIFCSGTGFSKSEYTFEEFFDKDLFPFLRNMKESDTLKLQLRKMKINETTKEDKKEVFSLFFSDHYLFTDSFAKAVIINIDADKISDLLRSPDESTDGSVSYIMNSSGEIIYKIGEPAEELYPDESIRYRIIRYEDQSGYFTVKRGMKKDLIVFLHSSKLNWSLIRIIPASFIRQSTEKITKLTVWMSLLFLIVTTVFMYFYARRIYMPIDSIQQKLLTLEKDKKSSANQLKEDLFAGQFYTDRYNSGAPLEETFDSLGIRLNPHDNFIVLFGLIDRFQDFRRDYTEHERYLYKIGIEKIVIEGFSDEGITVEAVNLHFNKIAFICNETGFSSLDRSIRHYILNKIQSKIHDAYKIRFSFIISTAFPFDSMQEAYQKLVQTEKYKVFEKEECILHISDILDTERRDFLYEDAYDRQLSALVHNRKFKESTDFIEELLGTVRNCSFKSFQVLLMRLNSLLLDLYFQYDSFGISDPSFDIFDTISTIFNLESIDEISSRYKSILEKIVDMAKTVCVSRHKQLIDGINAFIEENSRDRNLSLKMVAHEFNFSGEYLGKLYKQHTGSSIAHYLKTIRLERVKKTLTETKAPIETLIREEGFTNKSHFFTLFRNRYGVSPGIYRKSRKIQENF